MVVSLVNFPHNGIGSEAIERLHFLASLPLVPGRGKEARKCNLSIASNPVSVQVLIVCKTISAMRQTVLVKYPTSTVFYDSSVITVVLGLRVSLCLCYSECDFG